MGMSRSGYISMVPSFVPDETLGRARCWARDDRPVMTKVCGTYLLPRTMPDGDRDASGVGLLGVAEQGRPASATALGCFRCTPSSVMHGWAEAQSGRFPPSDRT